MSPRVVVVGAGIVGTALGLRLARRGAAVTLVEAREPGTGTSAGSLAWLNANAKLPRAYFDLSVAGMNAWRALEAEAPDAVRRRGRWVEECGNVEWREPGAGGDALRERVGRLAGWGYPAVLGDAEALRGHDPGLVIPPGAVAARFPGESFLHTRRAIDGMIAWARTAGARLVTGDPVTVVGSRGTGGPEAVLASGRRLRADVVACCAGWHTPELFDADGPVLPLVDARAPGSQAVCLTVTTAPVTAGPRSVVHAPDVYLRPADGGGVCLESSAVNAAIDLDTPPFDLRAAGEEVLRRGRRVHTALASAAVTSVTRCIRPLPRDGHPIVGPVPGLGGVVVVVSHSAVTLAAHLAILVADEIVDGRPSPELAPYRWTRFAAA